MISAVGFEACGNPTVDCCLIALRVVVQNAQHCAAENIHTPLHHAAREAAERAIDRARVYLAQLGEGRPPHYRPLRLLRTAYEHAATTVTLLPNAVAPLIDQHAKATARALGRAVASNLTAL